MVTEDTANEYPLAAHVLEALEENPGHSITITISAGDHAYIRHRDGRWEFVKHVEYDWYAAGYISEERVAGLAANNSVRFLPDGECYALGEPSYWEIAARDDLFDDDIPFTMWRIKEREDELAPWGDCDSEDAGECEAV